MTTPTNGSLEAWAHRHGDTLALVGVMAVIVATGYYTDLDNTIDAAMKDLQPQPGAEQVTRVIDGDTIEVGGRTVRIIGADTPEVFGAEECGGREASAFTKHLLEGKAVTVITDPTQDATDRYGRTLAYLEVDDEKDGKDLGLELVAAGLAKPYKLASGKEPQRYQTYVTAAGVASKAQLGMYGKCAP